MRYDCKSCTGGSPCCWENPATYRYVAEQERRVGWDGERTTVPLDVARRWRWRHWPLHIEFTLAAVTVRWGSLAARHRGLHP